MIRTKAPSKKIQVNDEIINRNKLARTLSYSYGGDRNLYTSLGYPTDITYDEYFARFIRQDIANAIIERPVKYTWKKGVKIHSNEEKTDILAKAWKDLKKDLKLDLRFRTVDKLAAIGQYAVLLLGFDDVKVNEDFTKPIEGSKRNLLYVSAYSQSAATIERYEKNPANKRFGLPFIYNIQTGTENGGMISLQVHYSRVIHVAGEILSSDVKGIPTMEKIWNRLMDLEKLSGGSAEMFWRGARPGYQGIVKEGYESDDDLDTTMNDKIEKYENELTRIFINEGIELKGLAPQVSDPTAHVAVQVDLISTATAIPKRILLGSERGELSSSQDANAWADVVDARREEIAEPQIVEPFVDTCMKYGILPKMEYETEWESLHQTSDEDKAKLGLTRAQALKAYGDSMGAQEVMPPEAFLKFIMGLSIEQIDEILIMIENDAFEIEEEEDLTIPPVIPGLKPKDNIAVAE